MSVSQNGWPTNREISSLVVAGVSFPGGVAHHDGAAVVLQYVATQWHYRVEKLHKGWCWGYNMRPIRGQSSGYSNHAAGCALDHNAPLHPRGRPASINLSVKQIATIHAILHEVNSLGYGDILRWGGDYQHSPCDAMHVEIVGSEAATTKAAALMLSRGMLKVGAVTIIKGTTTPKPSVKKARHTVMTAAGASVVNVNAITRSAAENADALSVQKVLNLWYPHGRIAEDGIWGDQSYAKLDTARRAMHYSDPVSETDVRVKVLKKLGFTVRVA